MLNRACGFCPRFKDFHAHLAHFSCEAHDPNRFNEGVDAHDPVLPRVQAANAERLET